MCVICVCVMLLTGKTSVIPERRKKVCTGDNVMGRRRPAVNPNPIRSDKLQKKEKPSWKIQRGQTPGKLAGPHCKGGMLEPREKTLVAPVESTAVAKAAERDDCDHYTDPPKNMSRTKTNDGRRDVAGSGSSKMCRTGAIEGNTEMEGDSTELDLTEMGSMDTAKLAEMWEVAVGRAETLLGKSEDKGKRKREALEGRSDE